MTAQMRTLIFMLMFGVFMSNNIMVPVHELSHIHDEHETSLVSCDVYHAIHSGAISSNGYVAYVPSLSRCINAQGESHLVVFTTNLEKAIRAPPFQA
jgi:hypothetical protein